MADSRCNVDLKETIEKLNFELSQSRTKISELDAKVREQEEENIRLTRDLKECEEKCRATQKRLKFAEQKLAQFSHKPQTAAQIRQNLINDGSSSCSDGSDSDDDRRHPISDSSSSCSDGPDSDDSQTHVRHPQVNEINDDALYINSLPNEIILKIFSYLTHNQLGQIARVCRRWDMLKKSPILWKKVNVKIFSSDGREDTVAKSFINGLSSSVTFISLDFSKSEVPIAVDFEELCVKLHQNCPNIEDLIFIYLRVSYSLPEVINFCTQILQCVKKLVFHYCGFYKNSASVEFNNNLKIEVLDLYGCDFFHFSKKQFSKLLYLKELHLACTNVDDTWFEYDTSFLNQLHVLDLGLTFITDRTFLKLQNHGRNLKELYLCYCSLEDHHFNLTDLVFPHLKTICLFGFNITCDGVVCLLHSCPSLEIVYVRERVAESFAAHPFVVANRCKSGIVKVIDEIHGHNVDYSHN